MTKFSIKSDFPILLEMVRDIPGGFIISAEAQEVSDGYHTFDELYEHRHALFAALVKMVDLLTPLSPPYARAWKSKAHSDGSMYHDFFIAGITNEITSFQGPIERQYITYHLPMRYWDKLNIIELPQAPPYDGYTSADVIERLLKL